MEDLNQERYLPKVSHNKVVFSGRILHLDGDKKYANKSYKYYKKVGLYAVVKYVTESKQPMVIQELLDKYKPDILIITGHDGMIKKKSSYKDIYNYKNSRYFVKTIKKARQWDKENKLVIIAGACQSYYEALISAGANFASSPARIMIDFKDPLVVAEEVATTDSKSYVIVDNFINRLRDGKKGIDGIGSKGKRKTIILQ